MYTNNLGMGFIIICNKNENLEDRDKKLCIMFGKDAFEVFGADDDYCDMSIDKKFKYLATKELIQEVFDDFIKKNYDKVSGLYNFRNPEAWECPFRPEHIIKDGRVTINIGLWEGEFDCSYNKLTSLEGCTEEVNGDFICHNNQVQFSEEDIKQFCEVDGNIIVY